MFGGSRVEEEKGGSSREQQEQQLRDSEERLENIKKWRMAGEGAPADAATQERLEKQIEEMKKSLGATPESK